MKYRITKYNPKYRSDRGAYMREDWTSISDIGITYNKKILNRDGYLEVENNYLAALSIIFAYFNSKGVIVKKLEKNFSYSEVKKRMFNIIGADVEGNFNSIKNNDVLNLQKAIMVSTFILRETMWCELVDVEKNFIITFGYDYYLYCECNSLSDEIIEQIEEKNLFVDKL